MPVVDVDDHRDEGEGQEEEDHADAEGQSLTRCAGRSNGRAWPISRIMISGMTGSTQGMMLIDRPARIASR